MVGDNEGLVKREEVRAPLVQGIHDCESFLVEGLVVSFRGDHCPGDVRYQAEPIVGPTLEEDCSDGVVGGVGFHNRFERSVEMSEDGS